MLSSDAVVLHFSGYLQDVSFYKLSGSILLHINSSGKGLALESSPGPTIVVATVPKTRDWILFSIGCHIYQIGIPIITSSVYFDKGI